MDGLWQVMHQVGISSSIDLKTWTVIWTAPYPTSTHIDTVLTNQPAVACFYRAFWGDKP
jgi:hypothetical protein